MSRFSKFGFRFGFGIQFTVQTCIKRFPTVNNFKFSHYNFFKFQNFQNLTSFLGRWPSQGRVPPTHGQFVRPSFRLHAPKFCTFSKNHRFLTFFLKIDHISSKFFFWKVKMWHCSTFFSKLITFCQNFCLKEPKCGIFLIFWKFDCILSKLYFEFFNI